MDDVNVLRQACCAFRNLFLKLVRMVPFRQAITISSICNKVFRTMFHKPTTVCIIPRAGYRIGDRQSVEALQWLAYIGRTKNNITHAGNGREVHLPGVPNVKFDGYCVLTTEVFENLWCFCTSVNIYPIDICPSPTLKLCWVGKRRRKRDYNKHEKSSVFIKSLCDNHDLKNKLSLTPM